AVLKHASGEPREALLLLRRAHEIYKRHENLAGVANCVVQISQVLADQREYGLALTMLTDCIRGIDGNMDDDNTHTLGQSIVTLMNTARETDRDRLGDSLREAGFQVKDDGDASTFS